MLRVLVWAQSPRISWAFDYYHAGMRRKSCISHFSEHMERCGQNFSPCLLYISFLGLTVSQSAKGPCEPLFVQEGPSFPHLYLAVIIPPPYQTHTNARWAHNSLNLLEKHQCEVQKWIVSAFFVGFLCVCACVCVAFFLLILTRGCFFHWLLERVEGRSGEREKNMDVRETQWLVISRTLPNQGRDLTCNPGMCP